MGSRLLLGLLSWDCFQGGYRYQNCTINGQASGTGKNCPDKSVELCRIRSDLGQICNLKVGLCCRRSALIKIDLSMPLT